MTNDPAPLDLEEVKKYHVEGKNQCAYKCACCLHTWPCPTIRLVEQVEYLRNRLTNYYQDNCENAYVEATLYKEALEQIARLTDALGHIERQSTRWKRATSEEKYLIRDLELIEEIAREALEEK